MMNTIEMMTITFRGKRHLIPYDFILYIESSSRKLIIHTEGYDYIYYRKLGDVYEELPHEMFIRIHKSYIVSKNHISHYTNKNVTIDNGKLLPISQSYKNTALEYLKKNEALIKIPTPASNITGTIQCLRGKYKNSVIRIYADTPILIGRDSHCDICYNLPYVSRSQCSVTFHSDSNSYEITDFSYNGTYALESPPDSGRFTPKMFTQIEPNFPTRLKPGTIIHFGSIDNLFQVV